MTAIGSEQLALNGGPKVREAPFPTGKRFGEAELSQLAEALEQNTLFYHHGEKVKTFLNNFNDMYGVKYSVATSSGTASIHVALIAAGVGVGDEVITTPITDMGTLIGILYQNAVPVFADVDPHTYNPDPASIEALITPRTKAILVVHLAGNPADMDPIMEIARKHGLQVVEDCAQSYLSYYKGRLAGTFGNYGCFSTNDFKHISTGDGGMVTINSGDEGEYHRVHAMADKNYQRLGENVSRDIPFLAPNYRMTELQGAVGIAQLEKLERICNARRRAGDRLTEGISELKGVSPHRITPEGSSSYWFYMFRVNDSELRCTRDEFSAALRAEGIPNSAGYIPCPVYEYGLFQRREAFRGSHFPFNLSDVSYGKGLCPNADEILRTAIQVRVTEFFADEDVDDMAAAIRKVARFYQR